ncbi:GatB/Yqey domain protein [Mycetohabitans rhizoxinica HKI 454]|uniref:GatB/Yqey domain protein n=2 Tax=Mycetohabitans rhizoxinica TaxID=412963 RepID=E5APH7_MYCRK|nr:GatB/Yqey domain protein [Mycetohabitans rhizoxinica HKI 454]
MTAIRMSLKDRINDDMKAAMRARDSERLATIRLLLAALKQREVDERTTLDDTAIVTVVDKLIKQRKDSISQFQSAGREDLVAKESAELVVLQQYMPAQLSDADVAAQVQGAIAQTGAAGPQDMGKVMALLKGRLAGRADMTAVSAQVKAALSAK